MNELDTSPAWSESSLHLLRFESIPSPVILEVDPERFKSLNNSMAIWAKFLLESIKTVRARSLSKLELEEMAMDEAEFFFDLKIKLYFCTVGMETEINIKEIEEQLGRLRTASYKLFSETLPKFNNNNRQFLEQNVFVSLLESGEGRPLGQNEVQISDYLTQDIEPLMTRSVLLSRVLNERNVILRELAVLRKSIDKILYSTQQ